MYADAGEDKNLSRNKPPRARSVSVERPSTSLSRHLVIMCWPVPLLLIATTYVPRATTHMPPASSGARLSRTTVAMSDGRTPERRTIVRDLNTLAEIDDALQACRETGRLAVIKFFSPGCPTCVASAPKFTRLARRHGELTDFYQINARRAKELADACGVVQLPSAQIYAGGSLALTKLVTNSKFAAFEHAFEGKLDDIWSI